MHCHYHFALGWPDAQSLPVLGDRALPPLLIQILPLLAALLRSGTLMPKWIGSGQAVSGQAHYISTHASF